MKKKESSLFRLIFALTLISLVASIALAAVNSMTREPIAAASLKKQLDAIKEVLPGYEGTTVPFKFLPDDGNDSLTVHWAEEQGEWFGAAVESYTDMAYGGRFTIMVGFDTNGFITGTSVLQMNETPGLGDKIDKNKNAAFSGQFVGKDPQTFQLKVKKDGGDVDAITAATISSRAFCDATERAYTIFLKAKEASHE